ncbi:MAG: hypothetical protein WAO78_04420, partial [Roseovarius sp.]
GQRDQAKLQNNPPELTIAFQATAISVAKVAGRSKREFPGLNQAEIHVGSEDWQSQPDTVRALGERASTPVKVVEGNPKRSC